MSDPAEVTFEPNDDARAAFKVMSDEASDAMMNRFFDIWEAEGCPRRAGSMAAHAYIRNAARMAVFGARCAGIDPDPELWRAACDDAFGNAVKDVATAFIQAAIDDVVEMETKADK